MTFDLAFLAGTKSVNSNGSEDFYDSISLLLYKIYVLSEKYCRCEITQKKKSQVIWFVVSSRMLLLKGAGIFYLNNEDCSARI